MNGYIIFSWSILFQIFSFRLYSMTIHNRQWRWILLPWMATENNKKANISNETMYHFYWHVDKEKDFITLPFFSLSFKGISIHQQKPNTWFMVALITKKYIYIFPSDWLGSSSLTLISYVIRIDKLYVNNHRG